MGTDNNLSLKGKIQMSRETKLKKLLLLGYISEEENESLRVPLKVLPLEGRSLAIEYFLLGIENIKSFVSSMSEIMKIKRESSLIAEDSFSEDGNLSEKGKNILTNIQNIRISDRIERAETFVYAKRKRLRTSLFRILRIQICLSILISERADKGADRIPYLRDMLSEYGYRARKEDKELTTEDKAAIDKATRSYLDLLELSYLNGSGLIRGEEYGNRNFNKETFVYRDIVDEALIEFETVYLILDNAVCLFYVNDTGKELADFLKDCYKLMLSDEYKDADTLRGSRFSYLLEEGNLC